MKPWPPSPGEPILSGDPELNVFGVASLLDATPEEASFLGNEKYFEDFLHTSAGIVLVPPGLPKYPENVAFVEVANPSMAFNALVKYFKASSYKFVPRYSSHGHHRPFGENQSG